MSTRITLRYGWMLYWIHETGNDKEFCEGTGTVEERMKPAVCRLIEEVAETIFLTEDVLFPTMLQRMPFVRLP